MSNRRKSPRVRESLRPPPVPAGGSSTSTENAGKRSPNDTDFCVGGAVRLDIFPDEHFTVDEVRRTDLWLRHAHGWNLKAPKWRVSRVGR